MSSSPKPQAKPSTPATKSQSFTSKAAKSSNADNQGQGMNPKKVAPKKPTSANPTAPPQTVTPGTPIPPSGSPAGPAPGSNPNLPADSVQATRGGKRPDRSLIDALMEPGANVSAQKYKGSVLSSVYKMPANPAKTAKTLQQFNGPRGQKMTLGA
jgi:hypothetical protein